jgi:hypothetical protein
MQVIIRLVMTLLRDAKRHTFRCVLAQETSTLLFINQVIAGF